MPRSWANPQGMKKAFAALLVAVLVVPAQVAAQEAGPGPGYFATDNVEWITTIPIETDSPGARIVGKYMYITTSRGLAIYDLKDPEAPERVGFLLMPQEPQFAEEDVDTNGKILLIESLGTLSVIDVEGKTNPVVIGEVDSGEHTVSCVLKCRWAYGSSGTIYDLRNPRKPKVAGDWGKGRPAQSAHDVTEVKPGFVMTSSTPLMLLDARKDPAKPKLLAQGPAPDQRYMHSNLWPHRMRDRFLLVGSEGTGNCDQDQGATFMTFDARKWRETKTFRMIDDLAMQNGLSTDGDSLYNTFCAHWFEAHPSFRDGGLVAMAWYEHGTRFLHVNKKGKISEAGYFLPLGGATSGAYWVTDEILYAVDYQRGIDILRYTGKSS
jgi:hypothetical protein